MSKGMKSGYYRIEAEDGSLSYQPCPRCGPGQEPIVKCDDRIHTRKQRFGCTGCKNGFTKEHKGYGSCKRCGRCLPHHEVLKECTSSVDRQCGNCTKGHYQAADGLDCYPCCSCGGTEAYMEDKNCVGDKKCRPLNSDKCPASSTTTTPTIAATTVERTYSSVGPKSSTSKRSKKKEVFTIGPSQSGQGNTTSYWINTGTMVSTTASDLNLKPIQTGDGKTVPIILGVFLPFPCIFLVVFLLCRLKKKIQRNRERRVLGQGQGDSPLLPLNWNSNANDIDQRDGPLIPLNRNNNANDMDQRDGPLIPLNRNNNANDMDQRNGPLIPLNTNNNANDMDQRDGPLIPLNTNNNANDMDGIIPPGLSYQKVNSWGKQMACPISDCNRLYEDVKFFGTFDSHHTDIRICLSQIYAGHRKDILVEMNGRDIYPIELDPDGVMYHLSTGFADLKLHTLVYFAEAVRMRKLSVVVHDFYCKHRDDLSVAHGPTDGEAYSHPSCDNQVVCLPST